MVCKELRERFANLVTIRAEFARLFVEARKAPRPEALVLFRQARELRNKIEAELKNFSGLFREEELKEQFEIAEKILGKDFLGPDAVKEVWDVDLKPEEIPLIPFSKEDLEKAKELGKILILRIDRAADGEPLTMEKMNALLGPKLEKEKKGKVLYDVNWYANEEFYKKETARLQWVLARKEVIPNSRRKNYLEQTEELVKYVKTVFEGRTMPKEYEEAIKEFEEEKSGIAQILRSDWQQEAEKLTGLKINQMLRQTPAEALYDILVQFQKNKKRHLDRIYTWTSRRSADGNIVHIGYFDSSGAHVLRNAPDRTNGTLGVCFCRSL